MRCVDCGCSHYEPCFDPIAGEPCAWFVEKPPLCSICAFLRGIVMAWRAPDPSFVSVPLVVIA